MEHQNLVIIYSATLIELHNMISKNTDDSKEGNCIRDILEDIYDSLNKTERKLSDMLSGDLYMLSNEDMYIKVDTDEEKTELRKKFTELLVKAYKNRDEDIIIECLDLLKNSIGLPRHMIAMERSNLYGFLGLTEVSKLFYTKSYQIDDTPI